MAVKDGILAILTLGPAYGLQLRDELVARAPHRDGINVGQVYGTIERLVRNGQIEDAGATDDGLALYRLTADGRSVADTWLSRATAIGAWEEMLDHVLIASSIHGADWRAILDDYVRLWSDADATTSSRSGRVPLPQGDPGGTANPQAGPDGTANPQADQAGPGDVAAPPINPSGTATPHIGPSDTAGWHIGPSSTALSHVDPSDTARPHVDPSDTARPHIDPSDTARAHIDPGETAFLHTGPGDTAAALIDQERGRTAQPGPGDTPIAPTHTGRDAVAAAAPQSGSTIPPVKPDSSGGALDVALNDGPMRTSAATRLLAVATSVRVRAALDWLHAAREEFSRCDPAIARQETRRRRGRPSLRSSGGVSENAAAAHPGSAD